MRAVSRDELVEDEAHALDERFDVTLTVAQAVQELGDPYRSVVLLRHFENRSHEEIAALLGRPLATVRTQLRRGLELLRAKLDTKYGGRETWSAALVTWIARQSAPPVAAPPPSPAVAGWTRATAAGLVLGGATWVVLELRAERAPPAPRDPVVATSAEHSALPLAASTTRPAAREPARPSSVASAAAPASGRAYLVGRVTERAAAGADPLEVSVTPLWRAYAVEVEPARGSVNADGTFRIALDALFRPAVNVPEPDEFEVVVDHPSCMAERLRLPIDSGRAEPGRAARYEVALGLRTAALVHGTVVGPDGSPLAGARAVAFAMPGEVPEHDGQSWGRTDVDGAFTLRVAASGRYAVAVLADSLRPATAIADAVVGDATRTGTVRLEEGHAITGVCLRKSEPLAGAHVDLVVLAPGARALLATSGPGPATDLAWIDGRFERARASATADAEGAFRAAGLAPQEHALVIADLPGIAGALPRKDEPLRLTAPADGVELALWASLVSFTFPADDPRPAGVRLVARSAGGEIALALEPGKRATLLAEPEAPLSFVAQREGGLPLRFDLSSPGPGEELEERIFLPSGAADAGLDLAVHVVPPVERLELWLSFVPADARAPGALLTRRVEVAGGRTRVDGVPPDAYRLLAHAGPSSTSRSYYADSEREIVLAPAATLPVALDLQLGGRLRLDVRDPRGERRRVQFRLLDAAGASQAVAFEVFSGGVQTQSDWYVTPWAPNELAAPLAPGRYELVLWDDDLPERRFPVTIEAGRTLALEVVLGD